MRLRAVGANRQFAEALGIPYGLTLVAGLAGCNALAALAGTLQADMQGFADVAGGQGILILALAAMAVGESCVPKRYFDYYKFVIVAAIFGSLGYHIIVAYAVRAGLAPTDLRLGTGILVLAVVALRFSKDDRALEALEVVR